MKATLRDHPLLTNQGGCSWPPTWLWTGGGEKATVLSEIGILRDVKTHDAISSICFLFVEHNGGSFIGRLLCESSSLCQDLVRFLRQHRGEPLKQIAGLGLDLTDKEIAVCSAA